MLTFPLLSMIEKIERNIQYYGLLRIPSNINNIKWWRLTADIVRPQISIYRNDRYPTPQGFWGYVQSMYAGRVLQTYRINYENEILAYNIDTDLFLQQNVSCSLEAVLTSFINLSVALQLVPFQRNNPIRDWRNLSLPIDEFRIRLIAERTVFKFTYEYEVQEDCSVPLSEPSPPPPPPPPPAPSEFPFDTPNSGIPPISDAYDGATDGGFTYKPDNSGEFPFDTEPCILYDMVFRLTDQVTNSVTISSVPVFGVVQGLFTRFNPNDNENEVLVIEGAIAPDGSCIQGVESVIFNGQSDSTIAEIVSITPRNP